MFSNDGKVIAGPAKRPLVHYAVAFNDKGDLIVDKSRTFSEGQWDAPGAFIMVA